jgi:hypothetical protein
VDRGASAASTPELSYRYPVYVSMWPRTEACARAATSRLAGNAGCFIESRGWRGTTIWFDTAEKAEEFSRLQAEWREAWVAAHPRQPVHPLDARYRKAALAHHAIVWGLSSGVLRDVVRAYRRSRYECSSHGVANFAAALTIVARCPHLDHSDWGGIERARTLAEYMLIYVEARHRAWFWKDLEGKHELFPFAYHH